MITFLPIKSTDVDLYNFFVRLLVSSFPVEEYRDLEELKRYTDTLPHFYNNIVLEDNVPVGFITYWNLGDFYYIEHFAIDPDHRNGGYGKKVLAHLKERLNAPIVLEVELPTEEMSKRRINFYQREGYTLWEKEYFQPPYKTGEDILPMLLMVNGELDAEKDFEQIKNKMHREVYSYP